jgi:hypothetical protein
VEAGAGEGPYGAEKDAYNKVTFAPVTTTACGSR